MYALGVVIWEMSHQRRLRQAGGKTLGDPPEATKAYQWQYSALAHAEFLVQGAFSEAGDVYALGVVIWEMSHQRRAWGGKRLDHIVRAVVRRHRTPKFQAHLPEHLTVSCGTEGSKDCFKACPHRKGQEETNTTGRRSDVLSVKLRKAGALHS